ncbi:thermonuclease family protein [Campylobacter sp. MG1]|uniref:thermonuclease family protein n=1 Tax=Campylobacter sp. MG1 TaxID=2976332 RepID=UPI00226D01BE|nr:thermonuclease family protein [Campylobacter sp. MG1]
MKKIFLLFFTLCLFADEYLVIKVYDGDSFVAVNNNVKSDIRLYGIDAPEGNQNFGKECKGILSNMILDKKINIDVKNIDKYKRKVAVVYLNEIDINRYMVQQGCAWAYTYYTDIYKDDELKAKSELKGLWIDKNAMEPYKFRKMNKYKRSESEEIKKMFKMLLSFDS